MLDEQADTQPVGKSNENTIKQYVQLVEEKYKPGSPKIFQVRRRNAGTMIQQRLETLRENATYRRRSSSREGSEEKDFLRSKSQPPQHRNRLVSNNSRKSKCYDDITVNGLKESLSQSHERLNASKSKESLESPIPQDGILVQTQSGHESLQLIVSDPLSANPSISMVSIANPICGTGNSNQFTKHGHESDGNRFLYVSSSAQPETTSSNQFVFRARSLSDRQPMETDRSPSPPSAAGQTVTSSKSMCKLDQLSSEVENLVIMKGWVRNLISKFQDSGSGGGGT